MRGHRDLRLVVAAAALCAVGSLVTPLGTARIVFAAPLTLFLPGYAIVAATFGRQGPGWPALLPLSVGASLSALALGSLLLNYTPGGLRAVPWALLLLLIVLGCCLAAAWRREPAAGSRLAISPPAVRPAGASLLVGAAALAATALILAQVTVPASNAFGYTELWMSPTEQSAQVTRVGVTSQQQHATSYRLEVRVGDRPAVVHSFSLAPAESRTFDIHGPTVAGPTRVEADLFKRAQPDAVYRHVYGWAPPAEGSSG